MDNEVKLKEGEVSAVPADYLGRKGWKVLFADGTSLWMEDETFQKRYVAAQSGDDGGDKASG